MKKTKCMVAICLLLMANFLALPTSDLTNTKTKLDDSEYSEVKNFSKQKDQYQRISDKIDEEVNNSTGEIDPEVEKFLNENGIFDDEILSMFSGKNIEEIKENMDNQSVFVSYYAVDDSEQFGDQSVTEESMIELSDEQVEKFIGETYYGEETDLNIQLVEAFSNKYENDAAKKSIGNTFLEAIGMKPIDAYALETSYTAGGMDDKINPTMLKKVMLVSQDKKANPEKPEGFVHVFASFTWTKMPVNKKVDNAYILFNGAEIVEKDQFPVGSPLRKYGEVEIYHYWSKKITDGRLCDKVISQERIKRRITTSTTDENNVKPETYCLQGNAIYAPISLFHSMEDAALHPLVTAHYSNEGISFSFYLFPNSALKRIIFIPGYDHLQEGKDIVAIALNTSFSVESGVRTAFKNAKGSFNTTKADYAGVDTKFIFLYK